MNARKTLALLGAGYLLLRLGLTAGGYDGVGELAGKLLSDQDLIAASVAVELGIKLSILGAGTRNVDGKAFGAMLVSLPENREDKRRVLDYLNDHEGVTAEEVR